MRIVKDELLDNGYWTWKADKKITCECTGEMDTGAKVWTDTESGEQYFLTRLNGRYSFYKG